MRKIIQITALPETQECLLAVFALCDDGTVWRCAAHGHEWIGWNWL